MKGNGQHWDTGVQMVRSGSLALSSIGRGPEHGAEGNGVRLAVGILEKKV